MGRGDQHRTPSPRIIQQREHWQEAREVHWMEKVELWVKVKGLPRQWGARWMENPKLLIVAHRSAKGSWLFHHTNDVHIFMHWVSLLWESHAKEMHVDNESICPAFDHKRGAKMLTAWYHCLGSGKGYEGTDVWICLCLMPAGSQMWHRDPSGFVAWSENQAPLRAQRPQWAENMRMMVPGLLLKILTWKGQGGEASLMPIQRPPHPRPPQPKCLRNPLECLER